LLLLDLAVSRCERVRVRIGRLLFLLLICVVRVRDHEWGRLVPLLASLECGA
jgi:hypothetical protein